MPDALRLTQYHFLFRHSSLGKVTIEEEERTVSPGPEYFGYKTLHPASTWWEELKLRINFGRIKRVISEICHCKWTPMQQDIAICVKKISRSAVSSKIIGLGTVQTPRLATVWRTRAKSDAMFVKNVSTSAPLGFTFPGNMNCRREITRSNSTSNHLSSQKSSCTNVQCAMFSCF